MAKIKQLKQHEEIFYPVTVGQAVIFEDDNTNAAITEPQMDEIFNWNRNYVNFISTTDMIDNFVITTPSPINQGDETNQGNEI